MTFKPVGLVRGRPKRVVKYRAGYDMWTYVAGDKRLPGANFVLLALVDYLTELQYNGRPGCRIRVFIRQACK